MCGLGKEMWTAKVAAMVSGKLEHHVGGEDVRRVWAIRLVLGRKEMVKPD